MYSHDKLVPEWTLTAVGGTPASPFQHLRIISRLNLSKCHTDSIPTHITRPFWEAPMHTFRILMEDGSAQMSGLNLWSGGLIAFISTLRAVSLLTSTCTFAPIEMSFHNNECSQWKLLQIECVALCVLGPSRRVSSISIQRGRFN